MAEGQSTAAAPDLRGLENEYEIRGELRGSAAARRYIGRRKSDGEEVAITILRAPQGGGNNALSHFASDVQILANHGHPTIARVIEGKWTGNDTYAVVTERVRGTTLGEMLERGDKFSNPRSAMLLQEVSGALDWARENGIVNRGVTPDSLWLADDTNGVRVSLLPTPVPITGVSDACGDARTIARLAWAVLTGQPHGDEETRSLGEVSPNLASRIVENTDSIIRCRDHTNAPDVGKYLGILAAGDVLKQAEVELAAQKEEYQEAHERELKKCELQREKVEQHAAEQASQLAGEREEFSRAMEDERAAMNAEREQMRSALAERQRHLAAVRAELDEQRAELERRLAELEQYRVEVEKVRDEALKVREAAHQAIRQATREHEENEKEREATAKEREEMAKAIPIVSELPTSKPSAPAIPKAKATVRPAKANAKPRQIADLPPAPKISKPPKPPKWDKIQRVEIVDTDEVKPEPEGGRPRWAIPAGVATLVLLLVAGVYGATHRTDTAGGILKLDGKKVVVPMQPDAPRAGVTTGGFLTPGAAANGAPQFTTAVPATRPESTTTALADSIAHARQDSIDAAQVANEARARRLAAAAKERERQREAEQQRRPTQAEIDSMNTSPSLWNKSAPTAPAPKAQPRSGFDSVRVDTVLRRDTSFMHRDTIRRDTTSFRPRPDSIVHRP